VPSIEPPNLRAAPSWVQNRYPALSWCGGIRSVTIRALKPDLPVVRPTRFGLIINLKTAKAVGRTIAVLAAADEAIKIDASACCLEALRDISHMRAKARR
jgi:hypothetical protein